MQTAKRGLLLRYSALYFYATLPLGVHSVYVCTERHAEHPHLVGSHASRARSTRRVPRGAGCLFIAALRTTYSRGEKHRAALSLRRSPTSPRSGVTSRGAERSGAAGPAALRATGNLVRLHLPRRSCSVQRGNGWSEVACEQTHQMLSSSVSWKPQDEGEKKERERDACLRARGLTIASLSEGHAGGTAGR